MNKVAVGVLISVVALGAIAGIVITNSNNQKDSPAATDHLSKTAVTEKEDTEPGASDTSTEVPAAETGKVTISDYKYSPEKITVKKGTTVTWTNQDSVEHTVTTLSADGPKSELFGRGESFSYTFNNVGTYSYICEPHPYMKGTVEVTE